MNNLKTDVLIVGGGPAGLSAAMTLARGGRSVIVADNGKPRNIKASHMNNFPSQDGTPPEVFKDQIKSDLKKYEKVQIINQTVISLERSAEGFISKLQNNEIIYASKIILAHGVIDMLPNIKGAEELFGKSIFLCPYCHGYEHRNKAMAIISNGDMAVHIAAIILGLTSDIKIFTNGPAEFSIEQLTILERNNIEIISDKLKQFCYSQENLEGIELETGKIVPRDFAFIKPNIKLSSDLGVKLGCKLDDNGLYIVDDMAKSTEKGVFVAGDNQTMKQSVLMACSSGQFAGSVANSELLLEHFHRASL